MKKKDFHKGQTVWIYLVGNAARGTKTLEERIQEWGKKNRICQKIQNSRGHVNEESMTKEQYTKKCWRNYLIKLRFPGEPEKGRKMKYKVEVSSFCTRLVQRKLTVNAKNEEEAAEKAILLFEKMEAEIPSSIDSGEPRVDGVVPQN